MKREQEADKFLDDYLKQKYQIESGVTVLNKMGTFDQQ